MKKIAIAAMLSAVVAAPAFAADDGFYAGVNLGRSNTSALPGAIMTKSNDTVYGILGGYQFTKNWGAEAFYTGAGKWTAVDANPATKTANGKADTWGIVGTGTLPLSDSFSLYGKLGYASTKTSVSCATVAGAACGAGGPTNATRGAATYGLGATYNVTPAIGIRFGWDRYGAAVTNAVNTGGAKSNYNSNVYSLAAVFKF